MKISLIFSIVLLSGINKCYSQQTLVVGDTIHLQVKRLDDTYIDAYLKLSLSVQKIPLLVMCQGSGTESLSGPFFAVSEKFKDKLARLVVEKPGIKYGNAAAPPSDFYKKNNAIYNRFYDYLRVFQYLRAHGTWWNGEVYIIGGSEGALMAGMLASFYPNVKAVAILGFGGGLTFREAWPMATVLQKKAEGLGSDEIKKAEQSVKDTFLLISKEPVYSKSYDGEDNTYKWWASIISLRLMNSLLDLDIPIFVGHGSEDIMTPVVNSRKLNEEFIRQGKTNLTYKEYTGYNHGFADTSGKSHYSQVFVDAIEWMLDKK